MTYGQFLKRCRDLAGIKTKSDFARLLGYLNVHHYIAAENDKEGKRPSLDLLERAARAAGVSFADYIQVPPELAKPLSRGHQELHRQLQELLDLGDDQVDNHFQLGVEVFRKVHFRKR